jgi:hypothetical protein
VLCPDRAPCCDRVLCASAGEAIAAASSTVATIAFMSSSSSGVESSLWLAAVGKTNGGSLGDPNGLHACCRENHRRQTATSPSQSALHHGLMQIREACIRGRRLKRATWYDVQLRSFASPTTRTTLPSCKNGSPTKHPQTCARGCLLGSGARSTAIMSPLYDT